MRALTRENESASILARHGFDVEQNPRLPDNRHPDYLVEGRVFDHAAPRRGTSARNIASAVAKKVRAGQTDRVVLNLSDSDVRIGTLRDQFARWPVPGLRELLVIRYGEVRRLFP